MLTVQRGRLGSCDWNWQWADESALELVIPAVAGRMDKILSDYESHNGRWERAFNLPYFHDHQGKRLVIGHTRRGDYVSPAATPLGPWPTLYKVAGKVYVDGRTHPEADWETQAGPLLIQGGRPLSVAQQVDAGRYTGLREGSKTWRTGLGYKAGKVVHLISSGPVATLADLQAAGMALGCEWLIAGDGGSSVTLHQKSEQPKSRANDSPLFPAVLVFAEVAGATPSIPIDDEPVELMTMLVEPGAPNRPGTTISPRYVTVHNTANDNVGANAEAHARLQRTSWAHSPLRSWHITVDDKCAYLSIPLNEMAYHAGTWEGNAQSLGVEECMNADADPVLTRRNTEKVVAWLLRDHLNRGSDAMRQHFDWSGKNCPMLIRAKPGEWEAMKQRVAALAASDQTLVIEVMRIGARGEKVRELQRLLAAHGFDPGPIDGIFGPQTDAAVRAFQAKAGLKTDGLVGVTTWAALTAENSPPKPPEPAPDLMERIKELERLLAEANKRAELAEAELNRIVNGVKALVRL